jgi:hypothetical protein
MSSGEWTVFDMYDNLENHNYEQPYGDECHNLIRPPQSELKFFPGKRKKHIITLYNMPLE